MNEEFLHYIWKFRNFDLKELLTTTGETIEIISPGMHNTDAGPDFFNAKIRIGQTLWAGNVEIHVRGSDWKKHKHENNAAYTNIILHVVHESDELISDKTGVPYPTLEMKHRIPENMYRKYKDFKSNTDWVPCGTQIREAEGVILESWLERLLAERLENKAKRILEMLQQDSYNWEETFYIHLARNFGFRINAIPFELLAQAIPLRILHRYRDNLFQMEALLFGQAGLLNEYFTESYPQRLQGEYLFLAHKHKLSPLDGHIWKFLRLRPSNFPTLRIAQFAALIHTCGNLFSKMTGCSDQLEMKNLLAVKTSEFWHTHYHFHKQVRQFNASLGSDSVDNILINTIAPFVFVYGKQTGLEDAAAKAFAILENTVPEKNSIIRNWRKLGLEALDGGRTQALIELKSAYCMPRKCLDCGVGRFLLKNV